MNIKEHFEDIKEYFSPKIIGEVNDTYIKIVKINGEKVPWHKHENEDEMFYVMDGELLFEVEGIENFTLKSGGFYVVKKGLMHRVSSKEECKIMLIENKSTAHTGAVKSEITKSIGEQQY